jgi:hypothetical protein
MLLDCKMDEMVDITLAHFRQAKSVIVRKSDKNVRKMRKIPQRS